MTVFIREPFKHCHHSHGPPLETFQVLYVHFKVRTAGRGNVYYG